MKTLLKSNTISTGLAMFSMFFGAGNVVFPLAVGQYAQDQNFYAVLGLLITAVAAPFIGLIAMTLFDGSYKHFFERIGKVPGFLLALFIMGLIGPFGSMPRIVALAYSTTKIFIPHITLIAFSLVSCVIIFLMSFKRSRILDILGYVLTPLLLTTLIIIVINGIVSSPAAVPTEDSRLSIFVFALQEGYKMMDLMGAFFFSSIVILCLKKELHPHDQKDMKKLIVMTLKASCIGATLLGIIYIGFSYVASFNSELLSNVPQSEMIAVLSIEFLGPYGGIVAGAAVALACLTTAIALAAVCAEFIHEDISQYKIGYKLALALTIGVTFFMSTLEFEGIMNFLTPILSICYPALIVLSLANIMHKLYEFKWVKTPVFIVFMISLINYFIYSS